MLADSEDGGTDSGSMRKSAINSFTSQIECAVETGDEIVNRGDAEAPDFIKIDVEGFEREVIEGLSRTIAQKKPVICFEFIFLTQTEIEGLIPQGYRLAYISGVDGNLIENYDRAMQERAMDVVIAPVESLLWSLTKEK